MKMIRKWWSILKLQWKIRKARKKIGELYNMEGVPKVYFDLPDNNPGWDAGIVNLK